MKRFGLTWVLLMVWLAGHGQSLALSSLDTLMQSRPDSALTALVEGYETFDTSAMDRRYYHLLLSEALYKNDYAQTDREALLDAMAYYDSLCEGKSARRNASIPYLAARCHYMNGVGYYEMDSVVPACTEYLKALEIMEEHYSEKMLIGDKAKFLALINSRLFELFSDQYLHEQAIYFGKQSLNYYVLSGASPWHIACVENWIGAHYHMIEQLDSAYFYFSRAKEVLPDTNNLTYRDIASEQALLSYRMNHTAQPSLDRLHGLLAQAESEKEYLARCLSIGGIYYQARKADSAKYYLSKVFDDSESIEQKILSAQRMGDLLLSDGDSVSANKYIVFLSQQANPGDVQATLHSQLTELQHVFEQNRETNLHQQTQRWWIRLLVILGVVLGVFCLLAFILFVFYRETRGKLKKEQYSHKTIQSALSSRLKVANKNLHETTRQLDELKVLQKEIQYNNESAPNFNAFIESPICSYILKLVENEYFKSKLNYLEYKKYALTRTQKQELLNSADQHLSRFTFRLQKQYPSLTNDDVKYCCLYLLGLKEAAISVLMQRAYPSVCERNRRIKQKMGVQSELSSALKALI